MSPTRATRTAWFRRQSPSNHARIHQPVSGLISKSKFDLSCWLTNYTLITWSWVSTKSSKLMHCFDCAQENFFQCETSHTGIIGFCDFPSSHNWTCYNTYNLSIVEPISRKWVCRPKSSLKIFRTQTNGVQLRRKLLALRNNDMPICCLVIDIMFTVTD